MTISKIPFAQFVLNDIRANGAVIARSFMDSDYLIPARLDDGDKRFESGHWMRVKSRKDKDDWSLYCGWDLFGYKATIVRGPENFIIKVRGSIAKALLLEEDKLLAAIKARKKARKLERKQRELDAAWWP